MKKIVPVFLLALLFSIPLAAQIDDRFGYIDEKEIQQYGKPLVTALGTALNTGSMHTARVPRLFGFSIGIKAMVMIIPDKQKTFTPNLPAGYQSVTGSKETATFFGDQGGIYLGPGGFYTYPNGISESNLPFAFPQATVSMMGTELLVRYAPLKIKDKNITLFGLGLKHSISQYIPFCPVDLAVQAFYNKLSADNLFSSKHFAVNGQVSKTFGLVTAYGALQYESSKVNFDYSIKGDPTSANPLLQSDRNVTADVTGDNTMRLTVGGTLSLGFFLVNADYSVGSQSAASAGITFEF